MEQDKDTYIEFQRKLGAFYAQRVQPLLGHYNTLRARTNIIIGFIVIFTIVCSILKFVDFAVPVAVSVVFAMVVCLVFIKFIPKFFSFDGTELTMKKDLMNDFVKIFGDLRWNANNINRFQYKSPEVIQIKEHNLFKLFGILFDDCIDGTFQNVRFAIKEVVTVSVLSLFGMFGIGALLAGPIFILFLLIFFFIILFIYVSVIDPIIIKYQQFISTLAMQHGTQGKILAIFIAVCFVILLVLLYKFIAKKIRSNASTFKGVIVEFEMNKDFEGHTFILDNTSDGLVIPVDKNKYGKVNLEDIEFMKNYTVWSDNQIEARYILTTAFIERLKNMKTSFDAKYTRVSFKDKKMIIAIHTGRDMFRMSDIFSGTGKETFQKLFLEIYSILEFIKQLKLNDRLGL